MYLGIPCPLWMLLEDIQSCPEIRQQGTSCGWYLKSPGSNQNGSRHGRKHATFRQTVQANKRRKPLTEPFKNGSRVLVRGWPYTSSPERSKKLEPRWFGPFKVLEHVPHTDNYKLKLPPRIARQKPYFHVSSLKEYRDNDLDRFKSRRIDKPAPILIDNAAEWAAEQILDYRRHNNMHEFLVHWKGYERADDS